MDKTEKLRVSLPILRAFAGWSSEYLASLLGVSRVTFIKIENNKMTEMQYLAIRQLFDKKVLEDNYTQLGFVFNYLVDDDSISDKEKEMFRSKINKIIKEKGFGKRNGMIEIHNYLKSLDLNSMDILDFIYHD